MKPLIALSIAQTILLCLIGLRVMAVDARTDELALAVEARQAVAAARTAQPQQAVFSHAENYDAVVLTADDIRQIIREEVAALETAAPLRTADNGATVAVKKPEQTYQRPPAEVAVIRADADSDLDIYLGRGRISEGEMSALQHKIAQLPPEQRREMLGRITRAMNDGKLEGQF